MKTAAILGASGYGGGELIRVLDAHPDFEVAFLGAHSKAGLPLSEVHPQLTGGDRMLESIDSAGVDGIDVAFLALPHGASAVPAMKLLAKGIAVVDLGSDFRLDSPERYAAAYGSDHPFPGELGAWAYGIPELFRDQIASSDRVSAPGCFPTSAVLPIAPLVATGLVSSSGIIVDSMTGVSGAGRGSSDGLTFGAIDESVKAYKVLAHRHQPEMEQAVSAVSGDTARILFTPHLVPMQRGILSTIYMHTTEGTTINDVETAFDKAYGSDSFVQLLDRPPETRWVVGSNNAVVSYHLDERTGTLIALCAIDNLVKGASGQAVQCANVMFGFEESTGLPQQGWMP
jgi:N-acetyl-gamma-glutamyl-phosphate reductase